MSSTDDPRAFSVDEPSDGMRVDIWLARSAGLARASIHRMIDAGGVTIEGAAVSKSDRVRVGQSVEIRSESSSEIDVADVEFAVRYEDEHLAVVAKPAGVVVHPSPGARGPTLVQTLAKQMELAPAAGPARPGIVHRLDKGTSGLMVVAKTDEAYADLTAAIRRRAITRMYTALVHGRLRTTTGRIEAPVGRSANPTMMAVVGGGRQAATDFRVTERFPEATLAEVRLDTGRTHQIRVHFAHIGHPVIGDSTYGRGATAVATRLGLRRPFLHAGLLRFDHPISGRALELTEPLPKDLQDALEILRNSV